MFCKLALLSLTVASLTLGAPKSLFENIGRKAAANPSHGMDSYIVGGDVVQGREFPSVVSLKMYGSHSCGGSIINPEWILTAAHCSNIDTSFASVVAGSNQLNEGGIEYSIIEIHAHENFSRVTTFDDIAVWKVSPPIALGNGVDVVKLPKKDQITPSGAKATVIGWGSTSASGGISYKLLKADVKIFEDDTCNKTYSYTLAETQVCAGTDVGGKDACNGDSGGPLYVDNEIVGIVSWGKPCAVKGYPTVYTRVADYIDWIEQHIK